MTSGHTAGQGVPQSRLGTRRAEYDERVGTQPGGESPARVETSPSKQLTAPTPSAWARFSEGLIILGLKRRKNSNL